MSVFSAFGFDFGSDIGEFCLLEIITTELHMSSDQFFLFFFFENFSSFFSIHKIKFFKVEWAAIRGVRACTQQPQPGQQQTAAQLRAQLAALPIPMFPFSLLAVRQPNPALLLKKRDRWGRGPQPYFIKKKTILLDRGKTLRILVTPARGFLLPSAWNLLPRRGGFTVRAAWAAARGKAH